MTENKWPDYEKAYRLLSINKDSAFFYFNRSATSSADKSEIALSYYNMALLQVSAGDNYGAQESLTMSLKSLDEHSDKDKRDLATDYNLLGMTFSDLNEYAQAITYYKLGLQYADDPSLKPYLFNNLGNAYKDVKLYDHALACYNETIGSIKTNPAAYASALTNMAITKWLQDPRYNAAPELLKSLTIRKQQHNTWGENSSYAHLADFYEYSRPDSALWYAHKMFIVAVQLQSPYDQLGALQKLIVLSPPVDVKKYFRRYQSLSDSLETKRNAAKNQFALIRYNVEKAKADNLKLQKDNSDANYQIIKKNILISLISLIFIIVAIIAFFAYKKTKQKQQEHTQAMIKATEQKASKKVHDTLGNDIYAIMNKVEHDDIPDKEWLIDNINDVYQRARNLSHQITLGADEDFHEKLSQRLKSFGTADTRVSLVGNSPELWKKFDPLSKFELYYILQEFMVNMRKHSQATNVVIKFEDQGDKCVITYTDNGIGISADISEGTGIRNTGNRIKSILGEITFDSSRQNGLQIQISLPIA